MATKFKPVVASKIKIKRNDIVEVIAGKDRGTPEKPKRGRVLRVIADKQRVLVEGVGMVKKHMKPNPQQNIKGGIAERESTIHISNVMLVIDGKRTRVGNRLDGDKKVRFARSTGATITEKKR